MKKSVLIAMVLAFAFSAQAQLREKMSSEKVKSKVKSSKETKSEPVLSVPNALLNQRRNSVGGNQTQNTADQIQLSTLPNYTSVRSANACQVWYDQDINSISFIHRPNIVETGDLTSNNFRYDISIDGGNNWSINQGPVWVDDNFLFLLRYPQGLISNPTPSNTTPGNAYETYDGYLYYPEGTAGYPPRGRGTGVGKLDLSATTHHEDTISPYIAFPEDMFTVKNTGDIWKVADMFSSDGLFSSFDSILLSHGVWNSTSNDYDYTTWAIYVPFDTVGLSSLTDMNIVFNDAGTVGYIAMITNNDVDLLVYPDQIFYLSVLKTTDGGQTWNYTNQGSTGYRPDIIDFSKIVDPLLLNDTTQLYGATFDMDVVMDYLDNLHIVTGIAVSSGYSVFTGDSLWGLFDVYTQDQGSHWLAQLIAKPKTFRGDYGAATTADPTVSVDNRQFASRSWDGHKLFFSWFDTDTIYFASTDTRKNKNPDLFTIAYDVDAQSWTDTLNLTRGTDAFGQCAFASGAYYAIDSAGLGQVFSIPVVYAKPENDATTGGLFDCYYVRNANVDMSLATNTLTPLTLPSAPDHVAQINRPHSFSISSNYPNPFKGKTSFDIELTKAADVSVEVSNMLGEVLSFNKYSNLDSGVHTLTIDAGKLSAGVYTYKVKVGSDFVTKKMTIQ